MKDISFNDLIDEVHNDFPSKVPKFIIKVILKTALKKLYKEIKKPNREFKLNACEISKIYEITNGAEVLGRAMDIDETKVKPNKDVSPIKRLPYYNILTHNMPSGGKKKKIIGYRGNRKRKAV